METTLATTTPALVPKKKRGRPPANGVSAATPTERSRKRREAERTAREEAERTAQERKEKKRKYDRQRYQELKQQTMTANNNNNNPGDIEEPAVVGVHYHYYGEMAISPPHTPTFACHIHHHFHAKTDTFIISEGTAGGVHYHYYGEMGGGIRPSHVPTSDGDTHYHFHGKTRDDGSALE